MTRKRKTRREAGRIPAEQLVELEKQRSHPSQSKLKPKQRSVYQHAQQELKATDQSSQQPKRKSRLKHDPSQQADSSRQLLDQKSQSESDAEES